METVRFSGLSRLHSEGTFPSEKCWKTAGKEKRMYQYTNKNTVVNTPNDFEHRAELTYKKMIERVEGATDDFHNAYELLDSTVGLIKSEKMDDYVQYLVEKLSADCHDALALSKHLEAIADFSDTTEKAVSALYALICKGEFGIDCWNIMQGAVDAVNALDERGVGIIKVTDQDTGDEHIVAILKNWWKSAAFGWRLFHVFLNDWWKSAAFGWRLFHVFLNDWWKRLAC